MNRRGFLRLLGVAAGTAAVASLPLQPLVFAPARQDYLSKYELVRQLLKNGIASHDLLLEQALFSATPGSLPFLGLPYAGIDGPA